MIPLKDDVPSISRPIVTYIILGLNIIVFIYEISLGQALHNFITQFGAVPYHIFHPIGFSSYATLFSSMFIHAGLMHIIGNMLFLWIFADNIEDSLGHIKFVFFYIICGLTGALLHSITAPNSTIPMIGASGAISGVLGAYILLFPKAKILALIPLGFILRVTRLPAIVFIGIWFLFQFLLGVSSIGGRGGVAYFAHIGGFVMGFLLALPFKLKKKFEYAVF